jgi:sensor histidine kinase YesM
MAMYENRIDTGHSPDGTWSFFESEDSYVLFLPSQESDYLLISKLPQSAVLGRYYELIRLLLLVSLALIGLMTPIVFSLSNSFSKPIRILYESIRRTELELLPKEKFISIRSRVTEIAELDKALRKMKFKITESMDRLLLAQQHEMQSRMLALQAQMNPHFLYNTMATIAAMASDQMTDEIETLCENMSGLLRYIATDKELLVTVKNELDICEMYINCIRARFCEIQFDKNVPENILCRRLPKLSVQLLVENAVKFVTTKKAPWIISVSGHTIGQGFEIIIEDNGPGLSQEAERDLQNQIAAIQSGAGRPSLELGGMGVLNVYTRLMLTFEKNAIFTIENKHTGGVRVCVGNAGGEE